MTSTSSGVGDALVMMSVDQTLVGFGLFVVAVCFFDLLCVFWCMECLSAWVWFHYVCNNLVPHTRTHPYPQ